VPVLYIGRTVPKGYYLSNIFNFNTFHDFVLLIMLSVANTIKHRDKSVCVCVCVWSIGGVMLTAEYHVYRRENHASVTLSTTNPTRALLTKIRRK